MNELGRYVFSIGIAALLLAILSPLLQKKGAAGSLGTMLSGLFLLLTCLQPLQSLSFDPTYSWREDIREQAQDAIAIGEEKAATALREGILRQLQAYISDKAASLDAQLTVQIQLSQDAIPVPVSATISGHISPYGRQQMKNFLEDSLGIPKEAQTWI